MKGTTTTPWKPKCEAPTLKQTLGSPELQQHFGEFLESEYAEESLILWNEVEGYKKLSQMGSSPTVLRDEIKRIYELYIKPDAEFEVNLPGHISRSMEISLETFPLGSTAPPAEVGALAVEEQLLFEAQTEAHSLLLCHSFPRWLKSVEWAPKSEPVKEVARAPCPAPVVPPPPTRNPRPPSLAVTLGNPGLHRTFKKYLTTLDPHMLSALCLWEALEQFSIQPSSTPPSELKKGAKEIFEKYLKPGTANFVPIKEDRRIPIGKLIYDSASLVGFKPTMFLQVQDDAFQQLQTIYGKWCSLFGCWEGVPAMSANSQVTRVNLKNSRRSIIVQRPTVPGEKQEFDGDTAPTFEQTMRNPFLRSRALGLQNFAHFSQELEDFANNKLLSPEAMRAQACHLFRKYIPFKELEAQEPINQLPMSIREDLYTRLFPSEASTTASASEHVITDSTVPSMPAPLPISAPTPHPPPPPSLASSGILATLNSSGSLPGGNNRESADRKVVTATVFDKARVWCQHQVQGKFFELWVSTDAWKGAAPLIAKGKVIGDKSFPGLSGSIISPLLSPAPNRPLRPPPSTLLPVKSKSQKTPGTPTNTTQQQASTTNNPATPPRKQVPSTPTTIATPAHLLAQPTPMPIPMPPPQIPSVTLDQQHSPTHPTAAPSTTVISPTQEEIEAYGECYSYDSNAYRDEYNEDEPTNTTNTSVSNS
ncbi:hypothetical protein Pelo_4063 [Pelomyxa schiedti]|nr:hypothetical protein Pelo_4063 [Pelomyxa schiedti]